MVFRAQKTGDSRHRLAPAGAVSGCCGRQDLVQTEAVRTAVKPIAGNTPVHVVPNAVPPPSLSTAESSSASLSPRLELPSGRNWFVAVGRLSYEKGFDRLIEAFAEAADQCPDWNLVIIGDGPEKPKLQQTVQNFGLHNRVVFPGWIESPWLALPKSSIAIVPSRYEGFPNALLEAMSHGLAPISFDCESGPSEIITHNENGLLIPQDDVAGLAATMQSLANDDKTRTHLATAAQSVNDRFSPKRIFELWETVLHDGS